MFQNQGQLELFKDKLPQYGYGTDQKGYLHVYSAEYLIQKALVQANAKNEVFWMIYDLDNEQAMLEWQDRNAPPPNIVAINPENGHAHLFYGLEKPVHNNYNSSTKALRYLASIDLALTEKLGADPGYSKLIAKNPIHPNWQVFFPRSESYDLDELASWLDLSKFQDKRKRLPETGYGRNCTLFERLRLWAYAERRKPQSYFSQDMFFEAVLWRGLAMNSEFKPPLPHSEIRATAKSIAKWTWANMDPKGFQEWRQKRVERAIQVISKKALDLRQEIQTTLEQCPGVSQADIALMLGVTRETVNRHIQRIKADKSYLSDIRNVTPTKETTD